MIPDTFENFLLELNLNKKELKFVDDSARYGELPILMNVLEKHKVKYIVHSDAKYEYNAEITWFNGKESVKFLSTQDERIVEEPEVLFNKFLYWNKLLRGKPTEFSS